MRKRICAGCGNEATILKGRNSYWCKKCKVYVCSNCTPERECRVCSTKLDKGSRGTVMAMLVIFAISFIFLPVMYLSEDIHDSELENMLTASYQKLNPGERAKVSGTINSTTQIVIHGQWVGSGETRSGYGRPRASISPTGTTRCGSTRPR